MNLITIIPSWAFLLVCIASAEIESFPIRYINSDYSIPGQFVGIDLPQTLTGVGSRIVENVTCHTVASHQEEPFTDRYLPRKSLPQYLPWNDVKRAFWQWEGEPITLEAFKREQNRKIPCSCEPGCHGCHHPVHYKILGGRLYTSNPCDLCLGRRDIAEELFKVALYLFPLPDMDFLVDYGDSCMPNGPTIKYSACRNAPRAGFTMPGYGVWRMSLGPTQMAAYHACLWERYPPADRLPLAVWRGSSTNPGKITKDNYLTAPRVKAHLLSLNHSDLLDARITSFTPHLDDYMREMLNSTRGKNMQLEDCNRYCAILHLEGNGWAERLGQNLIHFPTPLLRIASNISAFFEQYLAPGVHLDLFAPDMSDLLDKIRGIVRECREQGEASPAFRRASRRMVAARALMDHVGLAEAMAQSLVAYKNHTGFPFSSSLEGFRPVDMACCRFTSVPRQFAAAVSAYTGRA